MKDAIEMQVDAVVHAGDLFDSRNPTLENLPFKVDAILLGDYHKYEK